MMNPEDDPRYLPPTLDFSPPHLTVDEVEADLQHHSDTLAMCNTIGWRRLVLIYEAQKAKHVDLLTSPSRGASDLDVIYALRQGVVILDSILSIEKNARDAVTRDRELLTTLREGSE